MYTIARALNSTSVPTFGPSPCHWFWPLPSFMCLQFALTDKHLHAISFRYHCRPAESLTAGVVGTAKDPNSPCHYCEPSKALAIKDHAVGDVVNPSCLRQPCPIDLEPLHSPYNINLYHYTDGLSTVLYGPAPK